MNLLETVVLSLIISTSMILMCKIINIILSKKIGQEKLYLYTRSMATMNYFLDTSYRFIAYIWVFTRLLLYTVIELLLPEMIDYIGVVMLMNSDLVIFVFALMALRETDDKSVVFKLELSETLRFRKNVVLIIAIVFITINLVRYGIMVGINVAVGFIVTLGFTTLVIWFMSGGAGRLIKKLFNKLSRRIEKKFKPAFQN